MNYVLISLVVVGLAAAIGVAIAAKAGLLRSLDQTSHPSLDVNHPLVIELAAELRILDALPISTKAERVKWDAARLIFDKKLRTSWRSIYDALPHELEHYLNDADIRAKDPIYAKSQRGKLAVLLTLNGS